MSIKSKCLTKGRNSWWKIKKWIGLLCKRKMIGKNLTSLAGCPNGHNLIVGPGKRAYEKINNKTLIDRS